MTTTFNSEEIPMDIQTVISGDKEMRCPHWTEASHRFPEKGLPNKYLIMLDVLSKSGFIQGEMDNQKWYDIKTRFAGDREISREEFIDYLTYQNLIAGKVCNRMFCRGRASLEPQEFKCPNCGKKTIFKRL